MRRNSSSTSSRAFFACRSSSVSRGRRTHCWTGMPATKTVSTCSTQARDSAPWTARRAAAKRSRQPASSFFRLSAASSSSASPASGSGVGSAEGERGSPGPRPASRSAPV